MLYMFNCMKMSAWIKTEWECNEKANILTNSLENFSYPLPWSSGNATHRSSSSKDLSFIQRTSPAPSSPDHQPPIQRIQMTIVNVIKYTRTKTFSLTTQHYVLIGKSINKYWRWCSFPPNRALIRTVLNSAVMGCSSYPSALFIALQYLYLHSEAVGSSIVRIGKDFN